eukprot:TRINITY_DN66990_c5_g2_i3.p1 TRINITY_DN66990_c5_g2~~TRINITY_DN66990_c5_g2_i3.p1  ORF type:complete len:254 (-),score=156.79 TRINITY_DN66990_c5_g2_i3:135-848(-)
MKKRNSVQEAAKYSILVSPRQRGNPILRHVRNIPWKFEESLVPDYQLGATTCALYISLKYAMLHPQYLATRMVALRGMFSLRVVLCQVDVEDSDEPLERVTRTAVMYGWTLICAFSPEESARYLETFKAFESKPADMIMDKVDGTDPKAWFGHVLLKIQGVNKTDVATLANTFGGIRGVANATMEDLALCPGIGPKKLKRIYDAFHMPLLAPTKKKQQQQQQQQQPSAASSSSSAKQ